MEKFLEKINQDIENLRVVQYEEHELKSDCQFLSLKEGFYQLNNDEVIRRESVVSGNGNAVCIFAVTKDKKILVVIQPRVTLPTKEKVNIELPAGYVEEGENTVQAGMRELEEETGYASDNVILMDSYYTSIGASGERIDLLLALDCVKVGRQHLDKDEFVLYEVVTLEEFKLLLDSNYIMDVNARLGYYFYLNHLMKEGCS